MVLDETQSTDVGTVSPGAVSESTGTSASSVAQGGEQATASGGVTAQPADSEGRAVTEGEPTPPQPEDDPLKDVPSAEELEQQVSQKVPYAQALLQLRKALEARNGELETLRGQKPPENVLPLIEQHGGLEGVQARLEAYNSLFTPVVHPETKQPEIDPATGFPRITAQPFIERVDAENPGMAEQLLFDALNYQADFGNGQKVRLYQHPAVQAELLKAYGLDPERLDDYRNIDTARTFAQDTGVTPEELETIPAEFHETYKSLPPGIRTDLKVQDEATRQFNLEVYKERADRKAEEARRQQQEAHTRQQAEAQARQYVAREQDSFVEQQLQESYASLMDDLASQVTFSGDAAANAAALDAVGAYVLALRDPSSSFAVTKSLAALGVKVDPSFHEAVASADKHLRDAKAYELMGQQGFAQQSLAAAGSAKKLALAKSATVALRIAKALGATAADKAKREGQALTDATRTRPVPRGEAGEGEDGILPAGMLPTDPRAGILIARQTGLLGQQ